MRLSKAFMSGTCTVPSDVDMLIWAWLLPESLVYEAPIVSCVNIDMDEVGVKTPDTDYRDHGLGTSIHRACLWSES